MSCNEESLCLGFTRSGSESWQWVLLAVGNSGALEGCLPPSASGVGKCRRASGHRLPYTNSTYAD